MIYYLIGVRIKCTHVKTNKNLYYKQIVEKNKKNASVIINSHEKFSSWEYGYVSQETV